MTTLYTSNDATIGFDATTTGTLPADWVASTGTWQVGTTNLVNGHTHSFACTTATDGLIALLTGIAAAADQEIVLSQKPGGTSVGVMSPVLRADAAYNNAYLCAILWQSTTTLQANIYKRVATSYTQLLQVNAVSVASATDPLMIRFQVVGTTIRCKIWSETSAEPTAWSASTTDSSVTAAGYAGFYNADSAGTVVSVSDVVVSSLGASYVTVDTPASQTAGAGFTLTGTYGGTAPTAMDISFDAGATWTALTSFSTATNTWSGAATVPASSGLYEAWVRDHNTATNTNSSAAFSVSGSQTITITTPGTQTAGTPFTISGTYTGTAPTSLNYEVDSGGFSALTGATIGGGTWSGSITIAAGGSHTVTVQESPSTSVTATTSSFTVTGASITIATPGTVAAGQPLALSGTYAAGTPTGLNYKIDSGGYAALTGATIGGGTWSGSITAPAHGSHTVTVQEANATSVTATSGSFNVLVAPNDAALLYSPLNWNITGAAATTINAGAYFSTMFTGTTCTLNFDASHMCSPASEIWWRIDGAEGTWTQANVASTVACTVPASTSGNADIAYHLLEVVVKSTTETANRWDSVGSATGTAVIFTGLNVASASLLAPLAAGKTILCYGDSITEGVRTIGESAANDTDRNDAMNGWAYRLGHLLGAEVAVVGFGATGLNAGGSGNVPALGSSYSYQYSGQARSFATPPDLIVVHIGTNDGSGNTVSAGTALLNGLIAACPGKPIAVLRPFNGSAQAANLQAAIAACNNPTACHYIDTVGFFNAAYGADSLNLHPAGPNNIGQISPQIAAQLLPLLYPSGGGAPQFENRFQW